MAADGKVVFEITADDAPLKKTVNQTENWLKKLDLGNIFDFSIGSMLADAVQNIGSAIKDFAAESVGLASDLQEVQNVVDVTFGNDAKTIETWSKKANKQFGLTELHSLSKKPHCIVAKWLLVVGEDRKAEKVATCGGRVS